MKQDLSWTKLPVLNLTPGFEPFGPSTAGTVEYIDYPSGVEPHVRITRHVQEEGKGKGVLFTARPTNPNELMRVLLAPSAMGHDVRNTMGGWDLFMPYMPHARQDRRAVPEDAESLHVMVRLMQHSGYGAVHVFDLHNPEATDSQPRNLRRFVKNYAPTHFLTNVIRLEETSNKSERQVLLVVPDKGMMRRLLHMVAHEAADAEPTLFADLMIRHEHLVCRKDRNPENGVLNISVPQDVDVKGRVCVIVDDICDGGGTFIPVIATLKERGAKRVVLVVSHGLFTKGFKALKKAGLDAVYTTDSWPEQVLDARIVRRITSNWQTLLGA
jgi:ribose-phosphate pyrophosphokinase